MSKREASTKLTHQNWHIEEAPEEAGVFKVASSEVVEKRVIRTAKRRITAPSTNTADLSEEKKPAFSTFTGFNFSFKPSAEASQQVSPFASLKPKAEDEAKQVSSPTNKSSPNDNSATNKYSRTVYLSRLKGLNESFVEWIRIHVEKKNPCCILTPVFRDYEKYLDEIRKECGESQLGDGGEEAKEDSGGGTGGQGEGSPPTKNKEKEPTGVSLLARGDKTFAVPTFTFSAANSSSGSLLPGKSSPSEDTQTALKSTFPMQGFSFGSGKMFSFGNASVSGAMSVPTQVAGTSEGSAEDLEEPPKNDFKQVKEEDSVFSQRVKVFVKKDGNFKDCGVGVLYVKPTSSEKYQVIVRADTSLGNILFNIVLTKEVPTQRLGKNNVMLVCIPTPESKPPPKPVLLRVKTSEDADKLLIQLDKYKK